MDRRAICGQVHNDYTARSDKKTHICIDTVGEKQKRERKHEMAVFILPNPKKVNITNSSNQFNIN